MFWEAELLDQNNKSLVHNQLMIMLTPLLFLKATSFTWDLKKKFEHCLSKSKHILSSSSPWHQSEQQIFVYFCLRLGAANLLNTLFNCYFFKTFKEISSMIKIIRMILWKGFAVSVKVPRTDT